MIEIDRNYKNKHTVQDTPKKHTYQTAHMATWKYVFGTEVCYQNYQDQDQDRDEDENAEPTEPTEPTDEEFREFSQDCKNANLLDYFHLDDSDEYGITDWFTKGDNYYITHEILTIKEWSKKQINQVIDYISGQHSDGWFENGWETRNGCFYIPDGEFAPVLDESLTGPVE